MVVGGGTLVCSTDGPVQSVHMYSQEEPSNNDTVQFCEFAFGEGQRLPGVKGTNHQSLYSPIFAPKDNRINHCGQRQ